MSFRNFLEYKKYGGAVKRIKDTDAANTGCTRLFFSTVNEDLRASNYLIKEST